MFAILWIWFSATFATIGAGPPAGASDALRVGKIFTTDAGPWRLFSRLFDGGEYRGRLDPLSLGVFFDVPTVTVGAVAAVLLWASIRHRRVRSGAGSGRGSVGTGAKAGEGPVPRMSAPAPEHAAYADRLWVQPGSRRAVQGFELRGMVYVGQGLRPTERKRGFEPALIDAKLPVDTTQQPDPSVRRGAFAAYEACTPGERAAYLAWLAGGRRDGRAPLGMAWLFFYGLERRALFDAVHCEAARRNLLDLRAEVQSLREVFGAHGDFVCKAVEFEAVVGLVAGDRTPLADVPPRLSESRELPLALRIGLARLAGAGRRLPWSWALAWLRNAPGTRLRTPVQRCASEFEALFRRRYEERHDDGLVLLETKTPLRVEYSAASPSFRAPIPLSTEVLFDVAARQPPLNALRKLADACCDELDAYSRQRGKESGDPSLLALAQLPDELFEGLESPALTRLREVLEAGFDREEIGSVDAEALFEVWGEHEREALTKGQARDLTQLCARLGLSLEPDASRGGPAPRRGGPIVAFRASPGEKASSSDAAIHATRTMWLAAVVAGADGKVSDKERAQLEQLEATQGLGAAEARRLKAHLRWLLEDPPGVRGLRRKLAGTPVRQRADIGRFSIVLAGADGHLGPAEMRLLRRIYKELELEPAQLDADVRALTGVAEKETEPRTTASSQPPSSQVVEVDEAGEADEAEAGGADEFVLDMDLVHAKLAETAEVSALLANVFAGDAARREGHRGARPAQAAVGDGREEEGLEEGPKESRDLGGDQRPSSSDRDGGGTSAGAAEPRYAGLDVAHSSLLKELERVVEDAQEAGLSGPIAVPGADFEEWAAARQLLPSGARETLNEAAYDLCDAPVLEAEDPLEILADVLGEMLAATTD